MANALPPPPTKAPDGSFAWIDWYNKLQQFVSQGGVVPWANIDFAGSSIGDIQNRDHNLLSSIQGGTVGERYHLTAAQHAALTAGPHNNLTGLQGGTASGGGQYYHLTLAEHTLLTAYDHEEMNNLLGGAANEHYHLTQAEYDTLQAGQLVMNTKASDPIGSDVPSGFAAIYKNTTSGVVKLWVNDGGTFKSVTLT